MIINFALTQFVPGGPIDQIIAQMEGGGDVFEGHRWRRLRGWRAPARTSNYVGGRGLPADFIAELEREFGFDKPQSSGSC